MGIQHINKVEKQTWRNSMMTASIFILAGACLLVEASSFVLPGPTVEGTAKAAKTNASVTARSAQDKYPISVIGTRSTSSKKPPTVDIENQHQPNGINVKEKVNKATIIPVPVFMDNSKLSNLLAQQQLRRADNAPSRDFDDDEESPKGREFDFSA